MSKRRSKMVRRALDALPLIPAVLVSATSGQADQPKPPPHPKAPPPPNKPPATPKFKDTNVLQVSELRLDPALPKVGETVTVTLRVQNTTGAALANVEWKLGGALNKNGTIQTLGANSSQTVTQTFKATAGLIEVNATVDPANKISEPPPLRSNNKATVRTFAGSSNTKWDAWARKAAGKLDKILQSVKGTTTVSGKVNAAELTVSKLDVGTIDNAQLNNILTGEGMPADVAQAFNDAFVKAYKAWADKYTASVPFAYPGFVAWPAAKAGPTPNVPFSLSTGASSSSITAKGIESNVRAALSPSRKGEAGASDAISHYSVAVAGMFDAWLSTQMVSQVMAKGGVPNFAPPYVPVGPVVQGTIESATGHLY